MIDFSHNHYKVDKNSKLRNSNQDFPSDFWNDLEKMIQFAKYNPEEWITINEKRNMSRLDNSLD